MLDRPSVLPPYCVICGAPADNKHHVIPGRRKDPRVPLLRLCGSGTIGHHGAAHARTLHFRWNDGWEYLTTDEPMKYEYAIVLPGWRRINE